MNALSISIRVLGIFIIMAGVAMIQFRSRFAQNYSKVMKRLDRLRIYTIDAVLIGVTLVLMGGFLVYLMAIGAFE